MMLTIFSALILLVAGGCAADQQMDRNMSTKSTPSTTPAWIVTVETSGGMTGHGIGRIRIASDASVIAGIGPEELSASARPDEMEKIEAAVAAAAPDTWQSSTHSRAGDQITYTVMLDRGNKRATAVWMDGTAEAAAPDARRLAELAFGVYHRVWDEARL